MLVRRCRSLRYTLKLCFFAGRLIVTKCHSVQGHVCLYLREGVVFPEVVSLLVPGGGVAPRDSLGMDPLHSTSVQLPTLRWEGRTQHNTHEKVRTGCKIVTVNAENQAFVVLKSADTWANSDNFGKV